MNRRPLPTSTQRRRSVLAGSALLALACAATFVLLPGSPQATQSKPEYVEPSTALSVSVTSPIQRRLTRTLAAAGSVEARDELLIGSDAAGIRLTQVFVDVGANVRQGQMLAQGDDRQLRTLLAQQQAMLRQVRAELDLARDQLQRAESVEGAGVYSQELLQARRSAAEAAAAKVELTLAQQRETLLRIEQTRVHAPADGVISRRNATQGMVVQPGAELFRLIRGGDVEWRAELPDHAMAQVKVGAPVAIDLSDGRSVEGAVRLAAPTVDPHTRNGLVYVSVPKGTGLRPGVHLQGRIRLGQVDAWMLPQAAVLNRDGRPFVYVLGRDGKARAVTLTLGAQDRGDVEVSGLPADARVITTGAGFVKEGEQVRVAETPAEPGRRS